MEIENKKAIIEAILFASGKIVKLHELELSLEIDQQQIIQAIDEMVDILGMGIANICYVLNPQTVVLGGGIMAQEEYLKERVEAAVARYLLPSAATHTSLYFAQHKNAAGMLGAFYHFMSMTGKGEHVRKHDRD